MRVSARALEQMSLADLIDPAHLFPIAGDGDDMTGPLHTPLSSVDREDEPHGRNHQTIEQVERATGKYKYGFVTEIDPIGRPKD